MASATKTSGRRTTSGRRRARRVREAITAAVFLSPLLLIMVLFAFYPLVNAIRLTFFDYSFLRNTSEFVGFDNYVRWATDPEMWHSLWISVLFFLYYVPATMILAFAIAYLIDGIANRWFAGVYRTVFYFPVVLPAAIVFHMWLNLYDPSYGLFGEITRALGLGTVNWLGDTDLALPALSIMSLWRLVGETVILMLVGLANIPRETVEAARVDGANQWQTIRSIILPMLTPILFLILVLRLKVLELTVEPLFMTEGGPINSTRTYGLRAYYLIYREDELGYASTWFIVLAILSVLIAVVAGKRMRKVA